MRLIDADSIVVPSDFRIEHFHDLIEDKVAYDLGRTVRKLIDAQPTVEPKRGHWIHDEDSSTCSECGDNFLWEDFNGVGTFEYCPTCGAHMENAIKHGHYCGAKMMIYLPEYQKFDWAMQTIESDDEKGREKARRKFLRSLMRKVNENFDLAVRYKEFSGDIHPHLNDGEALYEFRIVIEKTDLEGEKDET